MHFRKKSSAMNSFSNEFDRNELTTYTYNSRKTNLNDSFLTLYSDRKERDKEKSARNSVKSNEGMIDSQELKKVYEVKDKETGKIIRIDGNESEGAEILRRSGNFSTLTTKTSTIRSIIKIGTTSDVIQIRPVIPNPNIPRPSKKPNTQKNSLKEKLINFVENKINESRQGSIDFKTEGTLTTSERNQTSENDDLDEKSYFSFKGLDTFSNQSSSTPKYGSNSVDQMNKNRSQSKIFEKIKKLANSMNSRGVKNTGESETGNILMRHKNPKIQIGKVIRMSKLIKSVYEKNRIGTVSNGYQNEQDSLEEIHFPNDHLNIKTIKTIPINIKKIDIDKNIMVDRCEKQTQLSRKIDIVKLQSAIRAFLFRKRMFNKVICFKNKRETVLKKIILNSEGISPGRMLKSHFNKWKTIINYSKHYENFVKLRKTAFMRKMFDLYNKNSNKFFLTICFDKWQKYYRDAENVSKFQKMKILILKLDLKINNCLAFSSFFFKWNNKNLKFRKRDEKMSSIYKQIEKIALLNIFNLWRSNRNNSVNKYLKNYNFIEILTRLNISFLTKNFQMKYIFFKNLKIITGNKLTKITNLFNSIRITDKILENNKRSLFVEFFLKLKVFSTLNKARNKITRNLLVKHDSKNKLKIFKIKFELWKDILGVATKREKSTHEKNFKSKIQKYLLNQPILKPQFTEMINRKNYPTTNSDQMITSSIKKIIHKLSDKNVNILKISLLIWREKLIKDKFNTSSSVIQKFLRSRKRKFRIYNLFYKQNICLKATEKLKHSMRKLLVSNVFNKIKNEAKRRSLIRFMIQIKNRKLKNFAYCFRKIKRYVQIKTIMNNAYARKIQQKFRLLRYRQEIQSYIKKLKKLKKILNVVTDKNFRSLNKFLKIWKRLSMNNIWEDCSLTIQRFLRSKLNKIKIEKEILFKNIIRNLFRDHLILRQIKPFFKNLNKSIIINNSTYMISRYIKRDFINKLRLLNESGKFGRLLILLSRKRIDYLQESIERIKSQSDNLEFYKALKKIQVFYKARFSLKRNNKINIKLQEIMKFCYLKETNTYQKYLSKWIRNINDRKVTTAGAKITNFIKNKLNDVKFRKIWIKMKVRKINIYRFDCIKMFLKLKKVCLPFLRRSFSKLKKQNILQKRSILVNSLIRKFYSKYCEDILNLHFKSFREKCENLKIRDEYLSDMVKVLSRNQREIYRFDLFSAFKIHYLRVILKKKLQSITFEKIRKRAENKLNLLNFCTNLSKANQCVNAKIIKIMKTKIYRLYAFKVMSSFVNIYTKKEKVEDVNQAKLFLSELKHISIEYNSYSNTIRHRHKRVNKLKVHKYSSKIQSTFNIINNQKIKKEVGLFLVPILSKLFEKLKKNRLHSFYNKMRIHNNIFKLNDILTKVEKILLPNEEFFEKLLKLMFLSKSHSNYVKKVCDYSKNYFLENLRISLIKTSKITKLMYLIKLTIMHKNLANYKFVKSLIRAWRFFSKTKKLSEIKMSQICEELKRNFNSTSNEMFNEIEEEKQYEKFKDIFKQNSN
jgi:hypothetical protein